MFIDGSHLDGEVGAGEISDRSDRAVQRSIDENGRSTSNHGALAAGDATFHRGWTIHSAGPNPTDRMRPVMTINGPANPVLHPPATTVSDTRHSEY